MCFLTKDSEGPFSTRNRVRGDPTQPYSTTRIGTQVGCMRMRVGCTRVRIGCARVRVGCARVFRYKHVGISNVKLLRWGSKPKEALTGMGSRSGGI